MFSDALQDFKFSTLLQLNARSALKGAVDDAYQMADDVGPEGIRKLDLMMNEFKSWHNKKTCQRRQRKRI